MNFWREPVDCWETGRFISYLVSVSDFVATGPAKFVKFVKNNVLWPK